MLQDEKYTTVSVQQFIPIHDECIKNSTIGGDAEIDICNYENWEGTDSALDNIQTVSIWSVGSLPPPPTQKNL